jgi:hypothetical protein
MRRRIPTEERRKQSQDRAGQIDGAGNKRIFESVLCLIIAAFFFWLPDSDLWLPQLVNIVQGAGLIFIVLGISRITDFLERRKRQRQAA